MITFVNIAEQNGKQYYRGEYKTYNRAISYGTKDLNKMRDAVIITGNKNNVKRITMRIYRVNDGIKCKSACYISHIVI
jgi:hypothetical protein